MPEQILTELVADPTKHTAGVNKAKKDAQEFGKQWDTTAKQTTQATEGAGRSMAQIASGARGAASSIAQLAKGGGDVENSLAGASFQVGQLGGAFSQMAGASTGAGAKIASFAGSLGLYGAVAAAGYGITRDLGLAIHNLVSPESEKAMARITAAMRELSAEPVRAAITQLRSPSEDYGQVEAEPDFTARATKRGSGRAQPKAGATFDRAAFDERERQEAMAGADRLTAALLKNEEQAHADIAALDKMSADNRALLRQQESAAQDRAADERMAKAAARAAEVQAAEVAMIELHKAQIAEVGGDGIGLAAMLSGDETTEQFVRNFDAQRAALLAFTGAIQDAGRALLSANITVGMEKLIGSSVRYRHANKEAAKAAKASQLSTSESFKVATRDALKSVATRAAIEGAYMIASNLWPPKPPGLAAGAALLAVAALAGGAAAAIGPVTKTIPDSGKGKSDAATATGGGVGKGATEGPASQTVNVTVYTLPGTEANAIYEGLERGMNRARRERGRKELPT